MILLQPIGNYNKLKYEARICKDLAGSIGIPFIHWVSRDGENYAVVSDSLGLSLEELFNIYHRKFSLKTVLLIIYQLISFLEFAYNKSFLYRDIRPENFRLG